MTATLLHFLGRLPLVWLHRLGALLGWLVYLGSPVYARRMRENLTASGIYPRSDALGRALRACVAETGRGVTEMAKVWFGDAAEIESLVQCEDWHVVAEAYQAGNGVILLTPH